MNIYAIFQLGTYEGPDLMFTLWLALVLTYYVSKLIHKYTGMFPTLFGTKQQVLEEEFNNRNMQTLHRTNQKLDKL